MKQESIKINLKDAIESVNLFKKVAKDVDEMDLNATKLAKEEYDTRNMKDEVYVGLTKQRDSLIDTLERCMKELSNTVCGDSNEEKEMNIKKHIEFTKEELNEINKKLDDRRKKLQESRDDFMDKRLKDKDDKKKIFINAALAVSAGAVILHPKAQKIALASGKSILKIVSK